jgi:ATP-dependent Clp protease ATP-binding subunit ClpC
MKVRQMFERYTGSAGRVLFFARYEASQIGTRAITPEHILLGLGRAGPGRLAAMFEHWKIDPESVREQLQSRMAFGEEFPTGEEIPFSDGTRRLLLFAAEEADHLGAAHIGPEHLMLATLRVDASAAAAVLHECGMTLEEARKIASTLPTPTEDDEISGWGWENVEPGEPG